jgi:hypothetical protein
MDSTAIYRYFQLDSFLVLLLFPERVSPAEAVEMWG